MKQATVRYGDYSNTPYGSEEYLTVKTFGDFLKEETYQSVITFDFNDIKETDTISEAKLILHGCTYPAFSGEKRLIILKEGTSVWDEKTAVRNSFPGRIYSFNGLPDKNTWQKVVGQESEYFWQSARFAAWPMVALEYYKTGNEEYACYYG